MLCTRSNRITRIVALALFCAYFAVGWTIAARAEPPLTIPAGGPPAYDPNAIAFNSWLLYPQVNFLASNSNNYFATPNYFGSPQRISGWELGVTPSMTAIWSNGIHTTTLYGNFQYLSYQTNGELNSKNGEATWTQQYAPLRDLNFTFVGDYVHQTLQSGLTNALPNQPSFTGIIILPNGNVQLPNGQIINPITNQIVGQAATPVNVGTVSFVNPYDMFTASTSAQKIFNGGIVTVGASVAKTNYEIQGPQASADYINKTFNEDAAFWLGPVYYFYTDGTYNIRDTDANFTSTAFDSTAYRIVGGLGTRQFGLFRVSAYFGHQGSGASNAGSSGGNVYGGALTYYPTAAWTVSANIDETINLAPAGAPPATQALGIPGITPLQIALSSSSQITSASLHSSYAFNPQWTANGLFGYTHVENIGSPIWTNSYVADASLTYNWRRNLTLNWEYQYSSIMTNQPLSNANRQLVTMSATYKF